jgi:hypothetical protein
MVQHLHLSSNEVTHLRTLSVGESVHFEVVTLLTPYRKYKPPPGFEPVDVRLPSESSPFEHNRLSKDGLQLWIIRVPSGVR